MNWMTCIAMWKWKCESVKVWKWKCENVKVRAWKRESDWDEGGFDKGDSDWTEWHGL